MAQARYSAPAGLAATFVAAAFVASPATAQMTVNPGTGPYVGGTVGLGHDTNVFRTPKNVTATPDIYGFVGLIAGIDQPVGRQRLFVDASLRTTRYQDITQLNNEGYALRGGIDWETVGRLSGNLTAQANQTLARYGVAGAAVITDRNLERVQELRGNAVWGAQQTLGAEIGGATRNLEYSNVAAQGQNVREDSINGGLRYRPSDLIRFGVGVRFTDGRYPKFFAAAPGSAAPLEYERRDVDFTVNWTPTGRSTLEARLSGTSQEYQQDPSRDFDGVTGSLSWLFRVGGRLGMRADIFRDTGTGATFLLLGQARTGAVGDNSGVATGYRLGGTYEITGKTQAEFNLGQTRREFDGAGAGNDTTTTYGVGLRWAATRAVGVGCQISGEQRSSSSVLSSDYSARLVLCTAQMVLR